MKDSKLEKIILCNEIRLYNSQLTEKRCRDMIAELDSVKLEDLDTPSLREFSTRLRLMVRSLGGVRE